MELINLKINSEDPFLTSQKWNTALEFSSNFEAIISEILGKRFKGIYKPEKKYELNDYVWFNNKAYIITDIQRINLDIIQASDISNNYYSNGGFYGIKNKQIVYIKGDTSKIINITEIDKFAFKDNKNFFIAYKNNDSGTKLYKIPLNGKAEVINTNFKLKLKDIAIDDFYCYVLTENNEIHKFSLSCSEDSTYFEEVEFANNHDIVSIAVNNKYLFALNDNSDILIINKNGGLKNLITLRDYISNSAFSKISITDSWSLILSDGLGKLSIFLIEDDKLYYSYSYNTHFDRINSLTYSNNNISISSKSAIGTMLSSEYQMQEVDLKSLVANLSTIEIKNAYFAVDFTKGQLVSNGETLKIPKNFIFDPSKTKLGVYDDGTNKVQFTNFNGIQLHSNILKYNDISFEKKTIIIEFFKATSNTNFCKIPINGKLTNLIASHQSITGEFKAVYEILPDLIEVTVIQNNDVIETFRIPFGNEDGNEFILSSNDNFVLKKIISTNTLEQYQIDYLVNCNYIIPNHYLNSYLPCESKNTNGVQFIRNANKSIINTEYGIKVNLSDQLDLDDSDIALNTKGSKKIISLINTLKTEVNNQYSKKNHTHDFSEIKNIPIATVNGKKGITELSGSITETSNSKAATAGAVKVAADIAKEAKSIAETKLQGAKGTVNGWYQKHTEAISGDVANVFKTGKTGFFCGANLANDFTFGSHSWKHYITCSHGNEAGYTGIISLDFNGKELGFSSISDGKFNGWSRVWTNKNFNPDSKSDIHNHPYLNINGGILNGNLKVNGGKMQIGKSGNSSFICFDAQTNDPGYIEHYENINRSILRFSVSDDRGRDDFFSWGSTPGGNYSQCAYLYTDGFFHTDGGIHSSGNITAFSDLRLKENITRIKNPLKLIEELNGVIFDRKDNGLRQTGLIAQDVLKAIPEAVKMDEEGYYSVDYGSLIGLMTECIKELKAKVEKLESIH